jgi:hypothetical protein
VITGFSKTLILLAVPLSIYAVATYLAGIEPDWGISLLAACLCLATSVLWEHHVEERRHRMANGGLR